MDRWVGDGVMLASVALRYAEHVIRGRIFPARFLGAIVAHRGAVCVIHGRIKKPALRKIDDLRFLILRRFLKRFRHPLLCEV